MNRIRAEDNFVVEQATNWGEGCLKCFFCCADFENTYYIKANKEKKAFITIKEDSSCCNRMFCNPNHELDLNWSLTGQKDTIVKVRLLILIFFLSFLFSKNHLTNSHLSFL